MSAWPWRGSIRSGVESLLRDDFVRNGAILFGFNLLGNLMAVLYRVMLGRYLTTEQYGEMDVILQVTALISVPAGAVQAAITQYVAMALAEGRRDVAGAILRRAMRRLAFYSVVMGILMAGGAPLIRDFFQLNSVWPVLAGTIGLIMTVLGSVSSGGLTGAHRFTSFGAVFASGGAVKILLTWLLIIPGFGATGALAGNAGSFLFVALIFLWMVKPMLAAGGRTWVDTAPIYRYLWPTIMATGLGWALGGIDLMVVKHFYSPEDAGTYARVNAIAKIMGYVNGAFITILLPKVAAETAAGGGAGTLHLLLRSMGLGLAVSVAGALFCTIWPSIPIVFLHGREYLFITPWMRYCVWAQVPLNLFGFVITYCMGRRDFRFLWYVTPAVAVYAGLLWLFHATVPQVLAMVAAGGSLCLAMSALAVYRLERGSGGRVRTGV